MTDDLRTMYDEFSDKVAHYQMSSDCQGFPESNFCNWSSCCEVSVRKMSKHHVTKIRAPLNQRIFIGFLEEFLNELSPHSFFPPFFLQISFVGKEPFMCLHGEKKSEEGVEESGEKKNLIYHLFSLFHITDYSKSMFGSYLKLIL
jgi:hypothetical protein